MHLDRRDADGLDCVEDGDAGVRIGGGIDHDAVVDAVGLLDFFDECALVVRLEERAFDIFRFAGLPNEVFKGGKAA